MPPKAAREGFRVKPEIGIMALHRKCTTRFSSLPRSGILLSQFLQETEKKKRKSNRSSKSCQIRKRPLSNLRIEGLRHRNTKELVTLWLDSNVIISRKGGKDGFCFIR